MESLIKQFEQQAKKAIEHLQKEFAALQIGRASAALVEDIEVESYGSQMKLKAVANIACPDAKTIKIEPWDKSLLGAIEKALQEASLGINPQNMGEYILLPIPPMTEERRKQLVKRVHELAEQARISIRNARHEALKALKKEKDEGNLSEDLYKGYEQDLQKAVEKANAEVETFAKAKEKDILTI